MKINRDIISTYILISDFMKITQNIIVYIYIFHFKVKTALHELLSQTTLCSYIKTDVMAYNNNVSILDIKNIIFTGESQCQLNIALNFVCVFLSLCNGYEMFFVYDFYFVKIN
jgi:hypothetical protein